jgi:uncharacterized protein (DUF1501 family)
VAKAIGARGDLGQDRQVFFVALGSWDNHTNLFGNYPESLAPGNVLDTGRGRLIPTVYRIR